MASQNLRRRLLFVAISVWTALIGFSAFWNLRNSEQQIMNLAYTEAWANLNKDLSFRRWASLQASLYSRRAWFIAATEWLEKPKHLQMCVRRPS